MNEVTNFTITVDRMTKELVIWKIYNFSVQNLICYANWPKIPWKYISTYKINLGSNDGQGSDKILGKHFKSIFIVSSCGTAWYGIPYIWNYISLCLCRFTCTQLCLKRGLPKCY